MVTRPSREQSLNAEKLDNKNVWIKRMDYKNTRRQSKLVNKQESSIEL